MPNSAEQKQHQNGHKPNQEAMEQGGHSGKKYLIIERRNHFFVLENNMMEI